MDTKFMKNLSQKKQSKDYDPHISGIAGTVFGIFLVAAIAGAITIDGRVDGRWIGLYVITMTLIGIYVMFALKVANQWEKGVVLRLGKFHGLKGPGMFWILPIIDTIPAWIDHRVMVTSFSAERTLTRDTVPVDVDAVLFWLVWDAEKAALEVKDYELAISWASQTALREIIG